MTERIIAAVVTALSVIYLVANYTEIKTGMAMIQNDLSQIWGSHD